MKEFVKTEGQRTTANFVLQMLVALALVFALFVVIWQVALGNLKADSAVVGSIFTMFIVLVNFCFPNSIGAQQAQDTISRLASSAVSPLSETTTRTITDGPSNRRETARRYSEVAASIRPIDADDPSDFPDSPPRFDGLGEETESGR